MPEILIIHISVKVIFVLVSKDYMFVCRLSKLFKIIFKEHKDPRHKKNIPQQLKTSAKIIFNILSMQINFQVLSQLFPVEYWELYLDIHETNRTWGCFFSLDVSWRRHLLNPQKVQMTRTWTLSGSTYVGGINIPTYLIDCVHEVENKRDFICD